MKTRCKRCKGNLVLSGLTLRTSEIVCLNCGEQHLEVLDKDVVMWRKKRITLDQVLAGQQAVA